MPGNLECHKELTAALQNQFLVTDTYFLALSKSFLGFSSPQIILLKLFLFVWWFSFVKPMFEVHTLISELLLIPATDRF